MSAPTTVFASPTDRTAAEPPELRGVSRDGVRLLVARPDRIEHLRFAQVTSQLRAGDVLVVNTSATVPGQLDGTRANADPVVVHLANRLPTGDRVVELRTAPDAARPILDGVPGETVSLPAGAVARLLAPYPVPSSPSGRGNRLWRAAVVGAGRLPDYLHAHARPISYGYLRDRYPIARYQTVFGLSPGSAEMPSAGRPFTPALVTKLVASGVLFAPVTLHTGVSSPEAGEAPQAEWREVGPATARLVNAARAAGGRVVAVGTSATRALESAAAPDGQVSPHTGWTDLVISPDRPVRAVNGLITGWHDPEASHLLLVESVAGPALTQRAYDEAVRAGYLWHEFGDSCLLLP